VTLPEDAPVRRGTLDLAVVWLNELWCVDCFSAGIDTVDDLSELGALGHAKDVVPMESEAFCWIVVTFHGLSLIKVFAESCTNDLLPLLIDPPLVLELPVLAPSLQFVQPPYLLQSLLLYNLRDFLAVGRKLLVLLHHVPIEIGANWNRTEDPEGIDVLGFKVH